MVGIALRGYPDREIEEGRSQTPERWVAVKDGGCKLLDCFALQLELSAGLRCGPGVCHINSPELPKFGLGRSNAIPN